MMYISNIQNIWSLSSEHPQNLYVVPGEFIISIHHRSIRDAFLFRTWWFMIRNQFWKQFLLQSSYKHSKMRFFIKQMFSCSCFRKNSLELILEWELVVVVMLHKSMPFVRLFPKLLLLTIRNVSNKLVIVDNLKII